MRRSLRQLLLFALLVVLLGVLLWRSRGAITLQEFSWHRLGHTLEQANITLLFASILTIYVCYALRALRWMRLSRSLGQTHFLSVYSGTLAGFAAIFLLGRLGEPIRPIVIARKERLPVSGMFGVYVMERLMDTGTTVILAGVALLLYHRAGRDITSSEPLLAAARTTGILLFVALIGAVAFLVYFQSHGAGRLAQRLAHWHDQPGWKSRFALLIDGFGQGLQSIHSAADLAIVLCYTALHWALVALVYYWVPNSFDPAVIHIGVADALLLFALTMAGSTLQLPGVGGGAQLASFLALSVIFGVEKEPAAAIAIVIWLVTFASGCIAGVPLLIREGLSMAELRRLAREERQAERAGGHVELDRSSGAPR